MHKILYAEDDAKYRRLVKMFVENQGYQLLVAENGFELLDLYDENKDTALIILDVMMPEMDGLETCKNLREYSNVPILMLTALGDVSDEVTGLKIGADDYIAKPFSNEKLMARIEALIRRTSTQELELYEEEGFTFIQADLTIKIESKEILLTSKEFLLFKTLILNKNIILTRDQLLDKVWGINYEGDPRTLDTHIKGLRSKLGEYSTVIRTRRGYGYYYRSENNEDQI